MTLDPRRFSQGYGSADGLNLAWREALMTAGEPDPITDVMAAGVERGEATSMVQAAARFDRERLTAERLAWSICPLHGRDYAICFDDEDDECAAIRIIHPGHDT